jgi:alkyl sulfatase BDS1-like metallo-beta-lactamase superfamily hydrolase
VVDGVRVVFQITPEAEAPAEMNFFFPDHGWLCTAENCTHNMHNLVPIRGALIRDSLKWSKYIGEMIELWGEQTQLMFASHHWPRWGNQNVIDYLRLQRDLYRWVHDQTMRMANHGYTAVEIAEMLTMPPEFQEQSHTVGYYGHLAHNIKAVYQRYLSWYDGNPANLWKLPPTEGGKRYVELAGGADALLAKARTWFDAGEYRWVVELVNHLVFADPTNTEARELQADALEQLGYQSESATFRNAYLTGAQELRNGTLPSRPAGRNGYLSAMSIDQIFDTMAVRLKAEEVAGVSVLLNLTVETGHGDEQWVLGLSNRALHSVQGRHDDAAVATFRLGRDTLLAICEGARPVAEAVEAGDIAVEGDAVAASVIFDHLDVFMSMFALVEP